MRRLLVLFLVVFIPVLGATAQENVVTFAPPAAAATPQLFSSDYPTWQLAIGYQLNGDSLIPGRRFRTHGYNVSAVRYFNDWFGAEAQIGFGFGNTGQATVPPNLTAKSVFFGGGPRIAFRNDSRWEPWGHGVVGLFHFRFTQTATLGSNSTLGWLAGGGLDYHMNDRWAIRAQGDYLGTRFFGTNHRNYQVVSGIVLNF